MASYNRVTFGGSSNSLPVPFPYLDKAHVQVRLNNVLQPTSSYVWTSAGLIQLNANPAAGVVGEARRVTPSSQIVQFAPGNLDTSDLNVANVQSLFIAEEAKDLNGETNAIVTELFDTVDTVLADAVAAKVAAEAAAESAAQSAEAAALYDPENFYTKSEVDGIVTGLVGDPWALYPVGAFVELDDGVVGYEAPPTNKSYRYVELTAGLTGAGGYNAGVLTGEVVSGSAPSIVATAVVNLVGSPFNGKTLRLYNTTREFLRPGSPGTLQASQNLSHGHTITDPTHAHGYTGQVTGQAGTNGANGQSFVANVGVSTSGSATGITVNASGGDEARPRNVGVRMYRRIK